MKQCNALLRKEWNTHWVSFLMPAWFTGGVYVTVLIGWIISLIKGMGIVYSAQGWDIPAGAENIILYTGSASLVALLGLVSAITAITLADSVVNGGFKRRCEILHFSQPVPFHKIARSKIFIVSWGTILLLGILSLINSFVISLISGYLIHSQLQYGMIGWLQVWIQFSLVIMFLSSLYWLFAGLFKRKSFFMGTLLILGIQAVISILNRVAGLQIPSLLEYIGWLISLNVSFNPDAPNIGVENVHNLISLQWQSIFSWNSLLKIIYSIVFFVGGSLLYKRRELS